MSRKEKEAERMFLDVGYQVQLDCENMLHYEDHSDNHIYFFKTIECVKIEDECGDSITLSCEEINAIKKQIEELGW